MEKGTKLIYSLSGFDDDGNPMETFEDGGLVDLKSCSGEITFDQFVQGGDTGVKLIGITEKGALKSVDPEDCKLVNPDKYFIENQPLFS